MARINLVDLGNAINKATLGKYREAITAATPKWISQASGITKAQIVDIIKAGQSPVKGGRGQTGGKTRFADYSPSYKKAIQGKRYAGYSKRLRPVNLTLSGEMLRSIKSRPDAEGFSIWFTSPLAKYHNVMGAGKSKVKRKMLPVDKGDEFSKVIEKNLVDILQRILTTELKRD